MKRIFNWERLPFAVIYTPFFFLWMYNWIRCGSCWFFSNVNPTLFFSGYEGETKEEMFEQLPKQTYPSTIYIQTNESLSLIKEKMQAANLHFPVAVKPDIGTKGLLFRKIENEQQLETYHAFTPFKYLIQDYINLPLEMSIFFIRYPDEQQGKITGLIAKEYLHVKGDGISALHELIELHPKAFMMAEEQKHKHKNVLQKIIPENEIYFLNELGNHNRGARFVNLAHEIDDQLTNTMNEINLFSKAFYYGRYDIKTTSLEDLKAGKNISILEYNGVGSEPNHIYDIGLTYMQAMRTVAKHWKYMYEISRINYKKGIRYIPFVKGIKMLMTARKRIKELKKLDMQCML